VTEASLELARATLEKVLSGLGIDPAVVRSTDTDDLVVYVLQRGSASVYVSIGVERGRGYVRVSAPVVGLPDDGEARTRLYERLLHLNARGLSNAAFGVHDGVVVAVSERPLEGLDGVELEQMVTHLGAVADTFDDRLAAEFGVQRASSR